MLHPPVRRGKYTIAALASAGATLLVIGRAATASVGLLCQLAAPPATLAGAALMALGVGLAAAPLALVALTR